MDVSRLAIEFIEHARLVSYTEKSQRYLRLKGLEEVHLPSELSESERGLFKTLVGHQMQAYQELREAIFKHLCDETYQCDRDGPTTAQKKGFEGKSKEDARYVTALAVTGQVGMTINARNLTTMIRRMRGCVLEEVQLISHELERLASEITPSLIRYCDPEPIRQLHNIPLSTIMAPCGECSSVTHIVNGHTAQAVDDVVLAALIFQKSRAPFTVCAATVGAMTLQAKWNSFCEIYERMEVHNAAPRAFELPDVTFELIGSASFFAQLKRHRMATIMPQAYDKSLGCTVPETIVKAKLEDKFALVREQTEKVHASLLERAGADVAEYVLMQAHRRRVLVKMNARELYAFSRLREDSHAQWEIRDTAKALIKDARRVMPMTLAMACGKGEFNYQKEHRMSAECTPIS
jgi:thymidylate synthase ThyX